MINDLNFTGKVFLITGGTGGIGFATAKELGMRGAKLILLDLDENKLKEVSTELSTEEVKHAYYMCNLSNISELEPLIKSIIQENGPVDGFVHCAGVGSVRPLNMTKYDFMVNVMNINFFSYVEIIRCLSKKGSYNVGMNIVGVSAIGAYLGNSTKTAYCASKAAMNSATRCVAKELSAKGIRVNTVAPGVTNTAMASSLNDLGIDSEETKAIVERQYLGVCQPEDISNTIMFLLSDLSKMITGSCISVDGGKLTS